MDNYEENLEKLINEFRKLESGDETDEMNLKVSDAKATVPRIVSISVFATVLAGVSLLGLAMNYRPTVSELEKRSLTEFPKFSLSAFMDGSYFEQISEWYSDTYPFRETLLACENDIKGLYGISGNEQIVGDIQVADSVPTDYSASEETKAESETNAVKKEVESTAAVLGTDIVLNETADTENVDETLAVAVSPYGDEAIEQAGAVYIAGNSAYGMFYFDKDGTLSFITALNSLYDYMSGYCNIYTCIAPTSTGIMLSDEQRASFGCSDQKAVIDYVYGGLNGGSALIDAYSTLLAHRDEYIYFRTDHHWTALGAYYVYEQYCEQAGLTAVNLDDLEEVVYPDFLGTYYSASGQSAALAATPDELHAWKPKGVEYMIYYNSDMLQHTWPIINSNDNLGEYNKYTTFIGGDHALTVIGNPDAETDRTLLVFKDSFANPVVTFLVNNYKTIYVVDNRYITIDARSFCQEYAVDDCLILYAVDSIAEKNADFLDNNVVNP